MDRILRYLANAWTRIGILGWVLSGCYSTSLLTKPTPTPPGTRRATPAVVYRPPSSSSSAIEKGDDPTPGLEAALRVGVHERADIGIKVGFFHFDLNSLVLLHESRNWTVSAMPGVGIASIAESDPLPGGSRSEVALDNMTTSTRIAALKLPLLVGMRDDADHWGLFMGPSVQVGYRYCRSSAREVSALYVSPYDGTGTRRVQTCTDADRGLFVGGGGHFGLQVYAGRRVTLLPEISMLKVFAGPKAREVVIDEVRTKLSRGDLEVQFALGVQISYNSN